MAEDLPKALRLAIYARVSTDEQKEGQTIDSQIAELERFARERAWIVTGIYKDEGWSGAVLARPELDHLRDDATKGVFNAVLLNDVDRLARDVTHLGVVKRDLERKGVQVIFRKLPSESSPTQNLMVNILGSFAEFEREMIADRTRRGRIHKVEVREKYLGSNTSYGYRYTPMDRGAGTDGILELIPEEAAVVRQMFSWVHQQGLSARQVLVRLNERQVPTRKGAPKWGKSSVLRILHNEMYAGVWHYNKHQSFEPDPGKSVPHYRRHKSSSIRRRNRKEWIPLTLPESLQIVDHGQWQQVQEQLQRNIAFSPRNEKHAYLLKGLVRCGGCGANYVGEPCHGKFYYRCFARCKLRPMVKEEILNDSVWKAVAEAILHPGLIADQVTRKQERDSAVSVQDENLLQESIRQLDSIRSEESRLLEAYRLGVISAEQLKSELEKVGSKKRASEDRIRQLSAPLPISATQMRSSITDYCRELADDIRRFTWPEKRQFLRTLIKRITFDGLQASILAEIPVGSYFEQPRDPDGPTPNGSDFSGRIAPTTVDLHGRNMGRENLAEESRFLGEGAIFPHTFQVVTPVIHPPLSPQRRDAAGRFRSTVISV